ncbi:LADA_0A08856g1_1 [Lachancea dasiensis]|uniref:LADA_0A08856g1_1 n=1 Tax=Lachancea dasiensis TaxID=1072105 RepID=A0A1G4IQB9_9SACH|nr:LADA_0A08856g1_1 [Lachancea dasiensis]
MSSAFSSAANSYASGQSFAHEATNGAANSLNESNDATPWDKNQYKKQYKAFPYMNNYISSIRNELMDLPAECRKTDNEQTLISYYSTKVRALRNDSITSGLSGLSLTSDGSKKSPRTKHATKIALQSGSEHKTPLREAADDYRYNPDALSTGYMSYCSKLPIPGSKRSELLKRHNMWIPIMQWDTTTKKSLGDGPHSVPIATGPSYLHTSTSIYRAIDIGVANTFTGSTSIPPLFGESKIPSMVYQCTVELGDNIYTLGGLTPSYYYTDEMPNLSNYYVDGIPNLPPPLMDSVVNNPSMVNNHDLYIVSSSSLRVQKANMTGQVPPPLLCMTGSALTKRHIFYYGGFEIKTETVINDTGGFYLKKRAVLHKRAYILDVMTSRFTRVELVAQPTKFNAYPSMLPRFGHSQVSVKVNSAPKCATCAANMNIEGKNGEIRRDADSPSSPLSQPLDMRSQSESSFLTERNMSNRSTSPGVGAFTILITGGYGQVNGDDYETLNELWKIEVTVMAKGKRNFFKFADTALATPFTKLPDDAEGKTWPARRAFQACDIYDTAILKKQSSEAKLLENLRANFHIESDLTSPMSPNEKPLPLSNRFETYKQQHHNHHHHQQHHQQHQPPGQQESGTFPTWPNQKPSVYSQGIGKTLVIHGGSNKDFVYGDMWWFDLDTETWTRVKTYAEGKDAAREGGSVDFTLVGHKLIRISSCAVLMGGFNQQDVTTHWKYDEKAPEFERTGLPISCAPCLHLLDLQTSVIGRFYFGDSTIHRDDSPNSTWQKNLRMLSTSAVYKNGFMHLVGGLLCSSSDLGDVHLRGTFSNCTLPILSTPRVDLV